MIFLKMAFMNMIKHPKRSFLIMLVVAFSVGRTPLKAGLTAQDGTPEVNAYLLIGEDGRVEVWVQGKVRVFNTKLSDAQLQAGWRPPSRR